jgi:hypothetical protein
VPRGSVLAGGGEVVAVAVGVDAVVAALARARVHGVVVVVAVAVVLSPTVEVVVRGERVGRGRGGAGVVHDRLGVRAVEGGVVVLRVASRPRREHRADHRCEGNLSAHPSLRCAA